MKNSIYLIILLIVLTSCKSKEINGIWMSYDDRDIDENHASFSGLEGIIVDFDKSEIYHLLSNSPKKVEIDFKERKIRYKSDSTIYPFRIYKSDSIEIEIERNTLTTFKPLELNHPLKITKSEIVDILTVNCFRKFGDSIEVQFLKDFHPVDSNKEIRQISTIWNNGRRLLGRWFIGEINKNFFLFINIEDTIDANIYQITSIDSNTINLKPLKEKEYKLKELNACL